jgi:hypothetical protein
LKTGEDNQYEKDLEEDIKSAVKLSEVVLDQAKKKLPNVLKSNSFV